METKFKIISDGFLTAAELGGKTIGRGIQSIEFRHNVGENAIVKMELDLHDFAFLPDGSIDEMDTKPPEILSEGVAAAYLAGLKCSENKREAMGKF